MSQENVEIVERFYAAFARGDFDLLLSLVAVDAELHISDAFFDEPMTYRGRSGAAEQLRRMNETFEEFGLDPQRMIDRGERVLAIVAADAKGRLSGAHVQGLFGHLWTIRDAAMVRFQEYKDVDEALKAVGLEE